MVQTRNTFYSLVVNSLSLLIKVTWDSLNVTGSVNFDFVHILYSRVSLCLNELISTCGILLRLFILFIFINIFLLEEQESENWHWMNSTLNLQVIGQNQVCFDYLKY